MAETGTPTREPMPTEGAFVTIVTKGPLALIFYPVRSTPDGKLSGPSWIAGKKGSPEQILRDDIFSEEGPEEGPESLERFHDWHGHNGPLAGLRDEPYRFLKRPGETPMAAATRAFREPDTLFWRLAPFDRELAASLQGEDMSDIIKQMEVAYFDHIHQQAAGKSLPQGIGPDRSLAIHP